ncbi:hypothetical protein M3231_04980 [Neobacillus mesonae]|nr:hypothetical protein [Neobacillus mesonae]
MKLALFIFQIVGFLIITLGGYYVYRARQIEGMGALGAGFLGAAIIGFGALTVITSAIIYWIQKWRASRKLKDN